MNFSEIIDSKNWQKLQDHFAEVLQVTIRTIDPDGELLTVPSRPTNLCQEALGNLLKMIQKCSSCLPDFNKGEAYLTKNPTYKCLFELHNFVIPIKTASEEVVAFLLGGPVIIDRLEDLEKYRALSKECNIPYESVLSSIKQLKTFTYWKVHTVIELLREVSSCIVQLGYQKYRLKMIIPDLFKNGKLDKKNYDSFYLQEMLELFMDIASKATKTENASVMLLDKENKLTIRAARGLNYDIVKNTSLKLGEAIAGRVAKEGKSILITEETTDLDIKNNLRHPELHHAVVSPICINNEVMGVINVSTKEPANKLGPETVSLLEQLTLLASCAIKNFREDTCLPGRQG
ncbi:MAG: PocR ligand-binding domain-containing protein [Candidatus Omnitrophota bacterium]